MSTIVNKIHVLFGNQVYSFRAAESLSDARIYFFLSRECSVVKSRRGLASLVFDFSVSIRADFSQI